MASEHVIKHDTSAINIGTMVKHFTAQLLWRHIGGRADYIPRFRQVAIPFSELGETKVRQIGMTIIIEQDITGFQVTVNNAFAMGMG